MLYMTLLNLGLKFHYSQRIFVNNMTYRSMSDVFLLRHLTNKYHKFFKNKQD